MIHNPDSNMYTWTLIMLYIVRYSPWSSGPPTMFLSVTSDNATVFCYDFPTATTQQILEPEIIYNHGCQDFLRIFVPTSKKRCKVTKKVPIAHCSQLTPLPTPPPPLPTIMPTRLPYTITRQTTILLLLFLCPNIAKGVASAQLWWVSATCVPCLCFLVQQLHNLLVFHLNNIKTTLLFFKMCIPTKII